MVIENWFSEVMHESKTPWPNDEGPWSVPSVADVLCARWLGASAWAWPRCIVGFGAPAGDDWTGWNGPIDRPSPMTLTVPHGLWRSVLSLRQQLKTSDLGQFGAVAIHQALQQESLDSLPCVRTVGRILERSGVLDGRHRVRRPPPPRGWYLPEVAARHAELDSFDIVEGLVIKGGTAVEVLNGVSLHGGLALSCPRPTLTAKIAVEMIVAHWRECGLLHYAQFDNDTVFQGAHQFPDTMGRVARLCLSLEVMPVFVPPRETGFQAMIENYNGWWQAKVWARFEHHSLAELQERSARFVAASRRSRAQRIEAAPPRRPFPEGWSLDLKQPPQGRLIYLRRTTETGHVSLLGHTTLVDEAWPHRLVRVRSEEHTSELQSL